MHGSGQCVMRDIVGVGTGDVVGGMAEVVKGMVWVLSDLDPDSEGDKEMVSVGL